MLRSSRVDVKKKTPATKREWNFVCANTKPAFLAIPSTRARNQVQHSRSLSRLQQINLCNFHCWTQQIVCKQQQKVPRRSFVVTKPSKVKLNFESFCKATKWSQRIFNPQVTHVYCKTMQKLYQNEFFSNVKIYSNLCKL